MSFSGMAMHCQGFGGHLESQLCYAAASDVTITDHATQGVHHQSEYLPTPCGIWQAKTITFIDIKNHLLISRDDAFFW